MSNANLIEWLNETADHWAQEGLRDAAKALAAADVRVAELEAEVAKLRGGHDWGPSTVGHGELQCRKCLMTNLEAAILGWVNKCSQDTGT